MPDDDYGLTMIALDDALKLSKDLLDTCSGDASWLVNTISSLYAGNSIYTGNLGELPANHPLTFWLGTDVDDEATISHSGLHRTFSRGQLNQPFIDKETVVIKGKNGIVLEVVNSGGSVWGATLKVALPGVREIINANPNGNDNLFIGRRRMFIWTYTGM